jgi:hypothetical protein
VALLVLLSLALAACGSGGKPSPGAAYAKRLSASCTAMRKQIEALGQPSDTPISKVYPGTVRIGQAFVKEVRALAPPPGKQATVDSMLRQYGYYFTGLHLAYALLTKRHSQQGFIQTAAAADANRKLAVGYAGKLGAPECARQPFE